MTPAERALMHRHTEAMMLVARLDQRNRLQTWAMDDLIARYHGMTEQAIRDLFGRVCGCQWPRGRAARARYFVTAADVDRVDAHLSTIAANRHQSVA